MNMCNLWRWFPTFKTCDTLKWRNFHFELIELNCIGCRQFNQRGTFPIQTLFEMSFICLNVQFLEIIKSFKRIENKETSAILWGCAEAIRDAFTVCTHADGVMFAIFTFSYKHIAALRMIGHKPKYWTNWNSMMHSMKSQRINKLCFIHPEWDMNFMTTHPI